MKGHNSILFLNSCLSSWELFFMVVVSKKFRKILQNLFLNKLVVLFFLFLQVNVFSHIQNLSLRWHLNRKTGEVLQIISNSRHSISYLLNLGILTVIPSIVDIIFIIGYFTFLFNIWFSIILGVCLALYFGEFYIIQTSHWLIP